MDKDQSYQWPGAYGNLYDQTFNNDYHVEYGDSQDYEVPYSPSTDIAGVVGFMSSNFSQASVLSNDVPFSQSVPYLTPGYTPARQPQLYINTQLGPWHGADIESSTASGSSLINVLRTPHSQSISGAPPYIHISSPKSAPADGRMTIPDLTKSLVPESPMTTCPPKFEGVPPVPPFPPQLDVVTQLPMPHVREWKRVPELCGTNDFVPQGVYHPHTEADRKRYIKDIHLLPTIFFQLDDSPELGVSLDDILKQKHKNLKDKDHLMFVGCGPSVSIRIQWPGYIAWSKQIPTSDFKNPRGPITRAKLAKNIAACVRRFAEDMQDKPMEAESDPRWKIGEHYIKVDDLILVSLHHVSKGSWQPQLRLRRPSTTLSHQWSATLPSFRVS